LSSEKPGAAGALGTGGACASAVAASTGAACRVAKASSSERSSALPADAPFPDGASQSTSSAGREAAGVSIARLSSSRHEASSALPRGASPTAVPSMNACPSRRDQRSEEHTSELQSRENLVCRLLLEK